MAGLPRGDGQDSIVTSPRAGGQRKFRGKSVGPVDSRRVRAGDRYGSATARSRFYRRHHPSRRVVDLGDRRPRTEAEPHRRPQHRLRHAHRPQHRRRQERPARTRRPRASTPPPPGPAPSAARRPRSRGTTRSGCAAPPGAVDDHGRRGPQPSQEPVAQPADAGRVRVQVADGDGHAAARPTASATGSVPGRRPCCWWPPKNSGRRFVPRRSSSADARRAAELVAADRQGGHAEVAEMDGEFADRLGGVGVQRPGGGRGLCALTAW